MPGTTLPLLVEVHVSGGGCGGLLAVVEEVGGSGLAADKHEAASAEVSGEGVGDGEGEVDGYGGVDGVSSLLEDGEAGVAGVVLDACDHGVLGAGGLFGGVFFGSGLLGERRGRRKQKRGAECGGKNSAVEVCDKKVSSGSESILAGSSLRRRIRKPGGLACGRQFCIGGERERESGRWNEASY